MQEQERERVRERERDRERKGTGKGKGKEREREYKSAGDFISKPPGSDKNPRTTVYCTVQERAV